MMNEAQRLAVVSDLLELAKPLDEIAKQIAAMDWDYEGTGVGLQRQHLRTMLHRFLENLITSVDIEAWANLIEGREDVYFCGDGEERIEEVLHELANPLLTQPLDRNRARELLVCLD